jgi:hypothetical protein
MQVRVVNNHTQPIMLDNGTQLSAAGTEGSAALLDSDGLSANDVQRAERSLISIYQIQQAEAEIAAPAKSENEKRSGK